MVRKAQRSRTNIWDRMRKRRVHGIDPGCNFFIAAIRLLGGRTMYSCEGHPEGFYLVVEGSYKLALRLHLLRPYSVRLTGFNRWVLRRDVEVPARYAKRAFRWAAARWLNRTGLREPQLFRELERFASERDRGPRANGTQVRISRNAIFEA
jgi:hypothetical protein